MKTQKMINLDVEVVAKLKEDKISNVSALVNAYLRHYLGIKEATNETENNTIN